MRERNHTRVARQLAQLALSLGVRQRLRIVVLVCTLEHGGRRVDEHHADVAAEIVHFLADTR
jgi:hypothetical protein